MIRLLLFALVAVMSLAARAEDGERALIANSDQIVVVTTPSWSAKTGELHRFVRDKGDWRAVGAAVDVVVGTKGLGALTKREDTPLKAEGDGRAPAGVFALTRVLGKVSAPKSGLPSAQTSAGLVCIDDVTHPAYNRIVDANTVAPAYKSAEQMVRKDALYDVVVVVDFNHAEGSVRATPKAGSCVFMHVWRSSTSGTAGCTAMARTHLDDVVSWLDAAKHPLLVQLPAEAYAMQRAALGLPVLATTTTSTTSSKP